MNFDFAEKINSSLAIADFKHALAIAEEGLRALPVTEFHSVLGHSLLHETDGIVTWIDEFYSNISKTRPVKALYFELIEFDINTDFWSIDGFAYPEDGGMNPADMDWLCYMSEDSMTTESFILSGYKKLQDAFCNLEPLYDSNELIDENLQNAKEWCEQIIIARFMELMHNAHLKAKEQNLKWAGIPLYFTEHDYDFIVKSALS